jgi:hypothetical protein
VSEVWNINEFGSDAGAVYETEDWGELWNNCGNAFERIAKLMSKNLLNKVNQMGDPVVEYVENGSAVVRIEERDVVPLPVDYEGYKLLTKLQQKSSLDQVFSEC